MQALIIYFAIVVATLLPLLSNAFHPMTMGKRLSMRMRMQSDASSSESAPVFEKERIQKGPSVFIGSLSYDASREEIIDAIKERIGEGFESISVPKNPATGKIRGYGYVNFKEAAQVDEAIQKLKGLALNGREVVVDVAANRNNASAKPRTRVAEKKAPFTSTDPSLTVYISNLDFDVTEEELLNLSKEAVGEASVRRLRLYKDRDTGRVKGYAHLELSSPDDVAKAISFLDGRQIRSRNIRAAPSTPKETRENGQFRDADMNSRSIFLGNLSWEVNSALLNDMLTDILGPSHINIRLALDKETGMSRGFAHIQFPTVEAAEKAVVELNGVSLLGRPLRVDMAGLKSKN
eukprot:gene9374-10352_t